MVWDQRKNIVPSLSGFNTSFTDQIRKGFLPNYYCIILYCVLNINYSWIYKCPFMSCVSFIKLNLYNCTLIKAWIEELVSMPKNNFNSYQSLRYYFPNRRKLSIIRYGTWFIVQYMFKSANMNRFRSHSGNYSRHKIGKRL